MTGHTVRIITTSQLIQHTSSYYTRKWCERRDNGVAAHTGLRTGIKCACQRCGAFGKWINGMRGIKGYTNIWFNERKKRIECDECYGR